VIDYEAFKEPYTSLKGAYVPNLTTTYPADTEPKKFDALSLQAFKKGRSRFICHE
jgi:hypothetical protein